MDRLGAEASVSILLPAHQEAATIADVIRRCRAHTQGLLEIVVVDDGSTDGTGDLAEQAGARVIRLARNQGKGAAVRLAIPHLAGKVVVLLDADGQDLPEEIPLLLRALEPAVDLVVGSRFLGQFERGAIKPVDRAGNLALTELFNLLLGVRLTDTQAGFRAVRRETLGRLSLGARNYEIETDMLVEVLRIGGKIAEVPVTRSYRRAGSTDLSRLRDGLRILRTILRGAAKRRLAERPS